MYVCAGKRDLTYKHLAFALCNEVTMFISDFQPRVHQRRAKRDDGRCPEGESDPTTGHWLQLL